ncbi:NAD(+)/NADH kinase [bacterium]|jgi:NAD+ kinase|nr:NAD(+)/NADH kinase [bacterium]NBX72571.1 NAD(+)/NADH kinase [bacterium]
MLNFKKIGLAGAVDDHFVEKIVQKIIHLLDILRISCVIDERLHTQHKEKKKLHDMLSEIDILLIVGGDGTFLRIARETFDHNIPIIGIHCGRLGFLTEIHSDLLYNSFVKIFIEKKYSQEDRLILECHDTEHDSPLLALNDFVITQNDHQKMIEFSLSVQSTLVCQQRGDGIIVATPTGSTAYALSAGGPIIDPNLDVQLIVPMFAHTLNLRPLVFPANEPLSLLCDTQKSTASIQVNADGQEKRLLSSPHLLHIKKHKQKINLLHLESYSFYHTLRKKFDWSTQHIQQRK